MESNQGEENAPTATKPLRDVYDEWRKRVRKTRLDKLWNGKDADNILRKMVEKEEQRLFLESTLESLQSRAHSKT